MILIAAKDEVERAEDWGLNPRSATSQLSFGGFPGGLDGKESACNAGDPSSIADKEEPLEKGMATHSSILAWRIPWTEAPGGL